MRYRPFGRSGVVVSAVTLVIDDDMARGGQDACREMIEAALEQGVNAFHIETPEPDAAIALGDASGDPKKFEEAAKACGLGMTMRAAPAK